MLKRVFQEPPPSYWSFLSNGRSGRKRQYGAGLVTALAQTIGPRLAELSVETAKRGLRKPKTKKRKKPKKYVF